MVVIIKEMTNEEQEGVQAARKDIQGLVCGALARQGQDLQTAQQIRPRTGGNQMDCFISL